jgi:DNA/RNA endonuclease YhcR with UshA esterase domain
MKNQGRLIGECPSCGRFVGPYPRCPYCGADVGQRLAVCVFRVGSLVLAVLGLGVLLFVARRSHVPTVKIKDLSGTMNWAYLRLEGLVTCQPAYDPGAQSLQFWIGDDTGEILVSAYGPAAEALRTAGLVPVMGDDVAVEGTLRVKEDFQYLILNVPAHTEIRPGVPLEMSIAEAGAAPRYQMVRVKGQVRGDRAPYDGLRILTLRDASGEIDVTLPVGAASLGGAVPDVAVGQTVQVAGALDEYRGSAQLSVGRGSDLLVLDETMAIAQQQPIGDLTTGEARRLVAVEGVITQVSTFSAGTRCTLDDGSGTVTLLLWQDLYDALMQPGALVRGATVRVQGKVAEYRGELEIVPELPSDVTVVATAERAIAGRQLGTLTVADVGDTVAVEGVLTSLRSFSAGFRGSLDDGTGTVTLLLWQDLYDGLPEVAALAPGTVLRVEGEVAEYRGDLEVVPQVPGDVHVVGVVELSWKERAIGQITADDAGQTVQVTGRIAAVSLFSQGVRYRLDDGTGTITLLVWQDLYDRLEDAASLAGEAWVAVRGEIDEYQGELEIVPQVPADVAVLPPGPVARVTPAPTPSPPQGSTPGPSAVPVETARPAATAGPTSVLAPSPQPTVKPTVKPTPAVETRTLGAIGGDEVGRTFAVARAGIAGVEYFSSGVKYTLTDSTGSIVLLLWQNVLEEVPERTALFPGSQVRVTGEIDEYQGEMEIIPPKGSDVEVIARGERAAVEERAADHVTASDEGRFFVVAGTVARLESRGWLKVWLDDGTGEILVFVPARAVVYLPAGVGIGGRLRVTGEVDVYQGEIEIIPLAGADVEVQGP